MQFVSFKNKQKEERLGIIVKGEIIDLAKHAQMVGIRLPSNMKEFLNGFDSYIERAKEVEESALKQTPLLGENENDMEMLAAVPRPDSLRDAYAFRQHVETARKNRGAEMIPEFDEFPVFYFSNRKAVIGSGDVMVEKDHLDKLDFELEVAVVISRHGKNIKAKDADDYIAGLMIMNDFSARALQMKEMKLSLGPAKGKDFATALGPMMVTMDELKKYKTKTPDGHIGDVYDLEMKAFYNGEQVSEGNLKDMHWTFAEIIERVSYGVEIFPGDVIGSGTVGTGCFLEINGTKSREKGDSYKAVWLKEGDEIELQVTGLGRLKNKVVLRK